MKQPDNIVFLGDTHAGSKFAPWPEEWLPSDPARYPGVRYLNRTLAAAYDALPATIDLLVLTGDLIDGPQRKSASTGIFTTSLGEQVEAATEILRPVTSRARVVMRVDGTPYHEEFHNALAALDEALGVSLRRQIIDIDLAGEILNVAHHPTGGSVLYKGTGVDRELLWAELAAARGKVNRPRWVVRAHKHSFLRLEDTHSTGISLPCWQHQTPHAAKQAYWRFQPDLGVVWFTRDDDEPGGYRVRHKLFDPLRTQAVTYGETKKRHAAKATRRAAR